jgi:hypothetical protein
MTTKEQFQAEMHDYANINEYYSYFGDVIYISTSYYDDSDYFLVLRTPKTMAIVAIPAKLRQDYAQKKNRKDVISDLTELEATIAWVVPAGYNNYVTTLINNKNFPDTNELISLKNNDINLWNHYFIENAIKRFKMDHTLLSRGITFDHLVKAGRMTTFTTAEGIYGTNFSLLIEWVAGNPFFDIKIKNLSMIKTRRLYYYDLNEFAELLNTLAHRNEPSSLSAVEQFVT